MSDIAKLDKNFIVETKIEKENIKFYNVLEKPFKVYGVNHENGRFRRMPEAVAKTVSEGVYTLHTYTAGGRVRFKTNSSYIAIHYEGACGRMPHMAFTGSVGFDLYVLDEEGKEQYVNTFKPDVNSTQGFEGVIELWSKKMREVTINFPTYSIVNNLYIGLENDAVVEEHRPYKIECPFVYYGSSITQGGCSSRPGTCYQPIISRRFDANFINLGWSGNGKGEKEIRDYMASLDMSLFVLDYDHNAPTAEHLEATHEPMYKAIREAHPDIPIIMLTRPHYSVTDEDKRASVIKKTYENAKASGDDNVYYLNGRQLMAIAENEGTVDNCHPTDLGFFSMAQAVGDIIEKILVEV